MEELIRSEIQQSIQVKERILSDPELVQLIEKMAEAIVEAYRKGKKVILFGNGGSAADAQHIAAELAGKYRLDRDPLPAIALAANTSTLTAIGNDYEFDEVFVRQLDSLGETGDVAIGISTSGRSENVIRALKAAKRKGLVTIAFTGKSGGRLKNFVDYCLFVPSEVTPRIQESHITVGHIVCDIVEKRLFGQLGGKHRAVFLDRDGVINEKPPEGDYVKSWEEFEFLPGVAEALRELKDRGFLVFVVTNQRGIARGLMTVEDLELIHKKMREELGKAGAAIDGIYYCPHDVKEHCICRKPKPGLLFRAAKEHDVDLQKSWMIGDSEADILAGKNAGCFTILIKATTQFGGVGIAADGVAASLAEAVEIVVSRGGIAKEAR
ncbi:MAG: D-glycero-beta-D-manno-heptose-1,7-bisphosphate 7-phosphatase [Deltaproteobacteria bacterium]|nr:MAG: D-glycero-beta-D-manno-heptose-1,7-bisphosphate 7-phosphatase [Deltaproteobacteria bacterium]